ncbi:hypothetical protein [Marinitoga lauensis]|uniref:hypothetical protein n=1 Tax=Marinitoga lauensis TaxID=2201189 RepID=UPI001013A1F0|nr:hypothetical protein [Marinitoga lauensis]
MIVLFNLNAYLGGGEVLLIRLAKKFKEENIKFCVIGYKGSYILEEAEKNGFNYIVWPSKNDSILYMNKSEKKEVIKFFKEKFIKYKELNIFTFCFRDIYNAHLAFSELTETKIHFSTGIYHPNDTKYLSSYSLIKRKIIKKNKELLKNM